MKLSPIPIILDYAFIILILLATGLFQLVIMEHVFEIAKTMQTEDDSIGTLLSQQESLDIHVKAVFRYTAGFIITIYLLWSLFQGMIWALLSKVGKAKKFWNYMGKFFALNILWAFAFWTIIFYSTRLLMYANAYQAPLISKELAIILASIGFFFLGYFAYLSYKFSQKKTLKETLRLTFVKSVEMRYLKDYTKNTLIGAGGMIAIVLLGRLTAMFYVLLLLYPLFAYHRRIEFLKV